ncbi:hypothetical protein BC834DRAFT_607869 [Gloeopeniophorella convolvens]|nr:hypothetical protein BC834DRAFT_607869 [Gloeopeniophorella convolvens]
MWPQRCSTPAGLTRSTTDTTGGDWGKATEGRDYQLLLLLLLSINMRLGVQNPIRYLARSLLQYLAPSINSLFLSLPSVSRDYQLVGEVDLRCCVGFYAEVHEGEFEKCWSAQDRAARLAVARNARRWRWGPGERAGGARRRARCIQYKSMITLGQRT